MLVHHVLRLILPAFEMLLTMEEPVICVMKTVSMDWQSKCVWLFLIKGHIVVREKAPIGIRRSFNGKEPGRNLSGLCRGF